jgi:hypothetical protein
MHTGFKTSGGEGGIRTPDTGVSPYNGLANFTRPLPIVWNQSVESDKRVQFGPAMPASDLIMHLICTSI